MAKMFNNLFYNKRVLVTGHTGFKGSWLSLWLNKLGAEVIGYALKPPTNPSLFELCNIRKKIVSINGNIKDRRKLEDTIKKYNPQMIFHMAAQSLVKYSYREPVETYETNVMGTVNVLEVCRHVSSVRAIVNITSDKCYDNSKGKGFFRENDLVGGHDPYSSSKGCAELVTNAYLKSYYNPDTYNKHRVGLASVRAGNVIGGGDWAEDRIIPDCVRAFMKNKTVYLRNPNATRPWQHVLEPLGGYLLLAQRLYQDGAEFSGAWNFGPNRTDIKEVNKIVDIVADMWGDNASWAHDRNKHPYEAPCLALNCSKAKNLLGWQPTWNLGSALKKTVDWYKAYRDKEDMFDFTLRQIQNYEEDSVKKDRDEV